MSDITAGSLVIPGRRGPRPRSDSPSRPRTVRLADAEHRLAIVAAKVNHQTYSEFVRDAIVTAASDCLETTRNT